VRPRGPRSAPADAADIRRQRWRPAGLGSRSSPRAMSRDTSAADLGMRQRRLAFPEPGLRTQNRARAPKTGLAHPKRGSGVPHRPAKGYCHEIWRMRRPSTRCYTASPSRTELIARHHTTHPSPTGLIARHHTTHPSRTGKQPQPTPRPPRTKKLIARHHTTHPSPTGLIARRHTTHPSQTGNPTPHRSTKLITNVTAGGLPGSGATGTDVSTDSLVRAFRAPPLRRAADSPQGSPENKQKPQMPTKISSVADGRARTDLPRDQHLDPATRLNLGVTLQARRSTRSLCT
jgi:hypothetical protein